LEATQQTWTDLPILTKSNLILSHVLYIKGEPFALGDIYISFTLVFSLWI